MKNLLDEKSISLLKFTLAKNNIYPDHTYCIVMNEGDLREDNTLVLRRVESDHWEVFYFERGEENLFATFYCINDAIKYFFWQLAKASSPYNYREEWEKATNSIF
jgi:hypothetical protein